VSFARHLTRAALALARTIPLGFFFFVLLSSGALVSSPRLYELRTNVSLVGSPQTRCKLATCSQDLSKSDARELVSSFTRVYHRRIVSDADALCCFARFFSASSGLRVT